MDLCVSPSVFAEILSKFPQKISSSALLCWNAIWCGLKGKDGRKVEKVRSNVFRGGANKDTRIEAYMTH